MLDQLKDLSEEKNLHINFLIENGSKIYLAKNILKFILRNDQKIEFNINQRIIRFC